MCVCHKYDRRTKIGFNLEQIWTWDFRKVVTNYVLQMVTIICHIQSKQFFTWSKSTWLQKHMLQTDRLTNIATALEKALALMIDKLKAFISGAMLAPSL